MPWCPKCKLEYVEGIKVCPDCGSTLVETLEKLKESSLRTVFCGNEAVSERIAQFLDYSHIKSVTAGKLTPKGYPVLVSEKEYEEAMKLVQVFMYNEMQRAGQMQQMQQLKKQQEEAQTENPEEMQEESAQQSVPSKQSSRQPQKSGAYIKKADKYEDMHSSGIMLLGVGGIGAVLMVLKFIGVIPLNIGKASFLFDITMSALFLFFIVAGLSSLKRAKELKSEVGEEEKNTNDLNAWFYSEFDAEKIDSIVFDDDDTQEELKYFNRSSFIRQALLHHQPDIDSAYLEDLAENIYQHLYENE